LRLQRNELSGDGRKLLNEELYDLYFLVCNPLIMFIYTIASAQVSWAGH